MQTGYLIHCIVNMKMPTKSIVLIILVEQKLLNRVYFDIKRLQTKKKFLNTTVQ